MSTDRVSLQELREIVARKRAIAKEVPAKHMEREAELITQAIAEIEHLRRIEMDPDVLLERIRQLCHAINEGEGYDETAPLELVEAFEELDGWMARGGHLPAAWSAE